MAVAALARFEGIVLLTLRDGATSSEVTELLTAVGERVVESAARGVLIDVSALSMVDSFVARMLASLVATARLLGAEAIIAGMRPEVAIAMVELGAGLSGISAAIDVDTGLAGLRQRIGQRP